MSDPPNPHESRPLLADLVLWLRRYAERHTRLPELDRYGKEDLERIAADAGVSAPELRVLAGKSGDAADLLYRRMAILRLDAGELGRGELAVLRDLQRVCAMCESRRRCVLGLAKGPIDASWEDYCPNAMTLRALVAAQPEPSDLESMIAYLNTVGTLPPKDEAH